jgi:hypothetical protein
MVGQTIVSEERNATSCDMIQNNTPRHHYINRNLGLARQQQQQQHNITQHNTTQHNAI